MNDVKQYGMVEEAPATDVAGNNLARAKFVLKVPKASFREGEDKFEHCPWVAFGDTAGDVGHLSPGDRVIVEGRASGRYTKEGKGPYPDLVVWRFTVVGKAKPGIQPPPPPPPKTKPVPVELDDDGGDPFAE